MLRLHDKAAFLEGYTLGDGKPHLLDAPVSGGVVAAGEAQQAVCGNGFEGQAASRAAHNRQQASTGQKHAWAFPLCWLLRLLVCLLAHWQLLSLQAVAHVALALPLRFCCCAVNP